MRKLKEYFMKKKSKLLAIGLASLACLAMSVGAFAEELTSTVDMKTVITEAGAQLTTDFSILTAAVIPVVLSVFGVGLVLFGIMFIVRKVKSVFTKSSN